MVTNNSAAPLGDTKSGFGSLSKISLRVELFIDDGLDLIDQTLLNGILGIILKLLKESSVENVLFAWVPVVWNFSFAIGSGDHGRLLVKEQAKSLSDKLHGLGSSLETFKFSHITTL